MTGNRAAKSDMPEHMILGGWIGSDLFDHLCNLWDFKFGGEDYEPEESDDPHGPFVLVRKRDGKRFEIEIDVIANPLPAKDAPTEIPGQTALPEPPS